MPDVREKLIEILGENISEYCRLSVIAGTTKITGVTLDAYRLADHLIANGVTIQRWIPVTERLPEDDLPKNTKKKMIRCFVCTDKGTIKPCVRQRWEHFDGQLVPWQWNKAIYAKPTHWMYYPQPPKEE